MPVNIQAFLNYSAVKRSVIAKVFGRHEFRLRTFEVFTHGEYLSHSQLKARSTKPRHFYGGKIDFGVDRQMVSGRNKKEKRH